MVGGQKSADYILSRSLPRPRDVLDLCQKAIDEAQRNGHSYVTAEDILAGELEFSEGIFWSIASEFRGLYPDIEAILIGFEEVPEAMIWSDFETIANEILASNKGVVAKWVNGKDIDPPLLADILFTLGLLGLSKTGSTSTYFSNGRSFPETWRLVASGPVVHIHPAFRKILRVSPVAPSSTVRNRGRQRVDPRQLPLDESMR